MLKIGITGSNGFIGSHLCNFLSLDRIKYKLIEFNREWFDNDIQLDSFILKCDIIIHLAGLNRHQNEKFIYITNISLAEKLINSFTRINYQGKIIFASSIHENKNTFFGNSKKKSTELFMNWASNNTNFISILIPNVYGPFGKPFYNSVISTFCHQLLNGNIPEIEVDARLNLIYINDLIKEIISLIDTKSFNYIKINPTDSYKVSDILDLLIYFNKNYIINGVIPQLNSNFEINLFNTFRSYIDISKYFPIKYIKHADLRGNFVEIIREFSGGQISFSLTKSGETRGNHFHTRKIERFAVIKGNCLIELRKKGTSEVISFYLNGDDPAYLDIPIWYIHNIKNIGKEDLFTIFWVNEFYDHNDSDTYFEKV
jgi:UDP-2-acetamido-2,6-beta-L-arabino-hexul-4-ose reductase